MSTRKSNSTSSKAGQTTDHHDPKPGAAASSPEEADAHTNRADADDPQTSLTTTADESDSSSSTSSSTSDSSSAQILPAEPGWMSRRPATEPALTRQKRGKGTIRRLARRLAGGDDSSEAMTALARVAADLRRTTDRASVSVAVTSTGPGNRIELTAIGLATLWARWEHNTLLLDAAGLTPVSAISRTSLDELAEALARGSDLPAPPLLTSALERLEVIATTSAASLARLSETGQLAFLMEALRSRYERIVWALPPVGSAGWAVCLADGIIDQVILSACRGKANRARIADAATQLAASGKPPLQLFWHG
ncbi:MAG: hypothetical protein D8M59_01280 [Planctomycetes bacterium]|nr:hypothetical protein [Planctomycetota bacterium]NOG54649.1 hypothetical protein [Planctomycetota bacterium]